MRRIYLSAHLDDAVLSAGGLIYEQRQSGEPVEIWSIMAGIPRSRVHSELAGAQHTLWGAPSAAQAMQMRREEDLMAAAILGASPLHLNFLDCIYRRDRAGRWLYGDIFGDPHPADADMPRAIARRMSQRLRPEDGVYCCLGIGGHVDHVLVRRAAELLRRPITFVADVPYVFKEPSRVEAYAATLSREVREVSELGLSAWIRAAEAYRSQIPVLFVNGENLARALRNYIKSNRGLPVWRQPGVGHV